MNKKFLSAILFGALMVSSTGTFVSCKDYDDDIDQINKELTDIKAAISELQTKVGSGKFVTNIAKEGDGIKITWNDETTSVIETIKGADGKDGKPGTVVTVKDGYWAFDGVVSEYPAKGEKGDKGEDGSAAAAGHDAKISADGYWEVWDAEKGDYVPTQYIAGGVTAVEVNGGFELTVRDNNGETQTIFIPSSSTMGYMDILNGSTEMFALYGINEKAVEYGPYKKTLEKGLYTTLDRDLQVVVNPQGTDASAYSYKLMNSANVNTELKFKEAIPYKGVLATRTAASENGVWVLPHDFTRYEDITDARTKNYLLFKANDGAKHALSLTATLDNTSIKTPYDLGAKLKKIGKVYVYVNSLTNCAVNESYTPDVSWVSPSVDAAAVYDYWITLEQSAKNLKNAALYGVEILDEGHAFRYTRETGVNNSIRFVYNYILMDGTVVEGNNAPQFTALMREEMASAHEITLERLYTALDAKLITKKNPALNTIYGAWSSNGQKEFALNTEAYDLTKMIEGMTATEKAVWASAIKAGHVDLTLIGGEGENNENWDNFEKGYNVRYAIADNAITFQFCVSKGYPYNFTLNNAYQLTLTVNDEDTGTPVASIILPFEFTQPTLDITRVNGEKAVWNGDVLSIYGDLVNKDYMYVPFYEAFTTAYAIQYSEFVPNAEYYTLVGNPKFNIYDGKFLGKDYNTLNTPLTAIDYSSKAAEWNTYIHKGDVNNSDIEIRAAYSFYGVYPATDEQVSDFTLRFASLLGDAKEVKANKEYISNNVTREVILTDADFTLTDALGDTFYLFDGVKEDGTIDNRSAMNHRQGFEEGTEGFATTFNLQDAHKTAYYYKNGVKTALSLLDGEVGELDKLNNAELVTDEETKTRSWIPGKASEENVVVTLLPAIKANKGDSFSYEAIPGGVMIQLPSSIGTTEPVTIEFELVDVFGVTKTLSVVVSASK